MMKNKLLVATRKGLVVFERSKNWQVTGEYFNGIPVSMVYQDPVNKNWWVSLDHGHWGIKLHRSEDEGQSWQEIEAPKYPPGSEAKEGVEATLRYIWAFATSTDASDTILWIGTEPGGLFKHNWIDQTTELNRPLWEHPSRLPHWFGGGRDFAGIHSIVIDPDDKNHLFIGISCAGVFETRDGGGTWQARNNGLIAEFLPNPKAEYGHDPHLLVASTKQKEIMWQQNHCGIFKSQNAGETWVKVSQDGGPAHFGFAIAMDDDSPDRVWVAPAVSDEIRVPRDHKLVICRTEDGGNNWQTLTQGLPQQYAYDIVYRHCLISQADEVVFGTTTGNLFYSSNGGDNWSSLSHYLPMVYCLAWAD